MQRKAVSIDRAIYAKSFDAREKGDINLSSRNTFFLPPTDIPDFIDVCFEKNNRRFMVEFMYTVPEKQIYSFISKTAKFLVGQDSGKPFRFEINDVQDKSVLSLKEAIFRNLSSIVQNLSTADIHIRQRANLEKTEELFKRKIEEMVSVTV